MPTRRCLLPRLLAALVLVSLLTGGLPSGAPATETEYRSLRVEVTPTDKAALQELLRSGLDVTYVHGIVAEVLVTPAERADLEARGYGVRLIREYKVSPESPLRTTPEFLPEYISYSEAVTRLNDLAATYPSLTSLTTIGTTHEGRAIYALKISDNAGVDEIEPEVLIIGNHHAREAISVIIPFALADSLLMNYGADPQFTEWVDERETWIVPTVNPDGLTYSETTYYFWRKNRRPNGDGSYGVDLNRNYDYEWGHDDNGSSPTPSSPTYRGPSPASELEIQAMQAFYDSREFVFSISYHSHGNLVLWGPAWKPGFNVDHDLFVGFGEIATASNGYVPGNVAMGAIYLVNGSTDDWAYSAPTHAKVYGFTPEVGTSSDYFNPPASRIPTLVLQGLDPALVALEYADRPERLAPPGQPTITPHPGSATGSYDVVWSAPTTADTQVIQYELTEKTGPAVVTEGLESSAAAFATGGWTRSTARKYAGSYSLYSGSGNDLNRICLAREGYVVQPGDEFTFRAWYDIESNWDYAYAILSTDGGRSWVNLAGTGTTMLDPNGTNADNGITGASSGWQLHTYDLSAWVGQTVWLGLRYYTDGGVIEEGIYVDDIWPVQTWSSSSVLSASIAGTSYSVVGRPAGTYWYSVRGQDAEGDWGYRSADEPVAVLSTGVALVGRADFFLEKAAPNPFSRQTALRFGLGRTEDHSLAVYDVSGRKVRTLSSGLAPAGTSVATWDGRDEGGKPVPSGVYFVRLTSRAGERIERAVVLR